MDHHGYGGPRTKYFRHNILRKIYFNGKIKSVTNCIYVTYLLTYLGVIT